ncbi:hypothetical protein L0669_23200 [Flavobacterium bizetiae]|uniref:hypothetical protein n=1 Tax=Flavobacterium bizetiae TaxID=2704140 RepID=UPI0021E95BDB|nr:hypothetical protein [Flavobacterium bizetiae]UTN04218.1 hypothetical protein L0669_23200 [Flavobacterium bizetiae]
MKKIILTFIIPILLSCTNKKSNATQPILQDNTNGKITEEKNEKEIIDSVKHNFLDTQKTKNSPVRIISAKLLKNQYSDHKDIQLTYKNTTRKNIKAIKFEWYCENVFDKPASGQFFFVKGISRGHTDILLEPRKTTSKILEDFSTDAHAIIAARAYLVVFTDGTKWELKQ